MEEKEGTAEEEEGEEEESLGELLLPNRAPPTKGAWGQQQISSTMHSPVGQRATVTEL